METLFFTNANDTYSTVTESQCSVRSDASTIGHSDNTPSIEGLIESSVDSDEFNRRSSDYSDWDVEASQRNEEYLNFRNQYAAESDDFDQITKNFNDMEFWPLPQFEASNMDARQFIERKFCDNNVMNDSMGRLPCETQNRAIEQQVSPQFCDNTNVNYIGSTAVDLSNMEMHQVSNMQMQQVLQLNCDNQNDLQSLEALENEAIINPTEISVNGPEGQSNLDSLPKSIFEDLAKVTNVRRKVDKQLNSSNVNIHIEKILPVLGVDVLEEEQIFDEENFNIFNFINGVHTNSNELCIEENEAIGTNIKQEQISPDVADNAHVREYKCKQEIVPKVEVKTELVSSNESKYFCGGKQLQKYQGESSTIIDNTKQHIPFKPPKVAGRKRIDMKAQRYIYDDDEENIDVETVTKGDNPVIEARDVDSLLAQFEATQFEESKKDKQSSSKQKIPKVKIDDKCTKKSKHRSKKEKKLKDRIHMHNTFKKDKEKCKNTNGIADSTSKNKHKSTHHHVEEIKISLKSEDLKSKDSRVLSKSSHTSRNSQSTKPEEQRKGHSRRRSDPSVQMKNSTWSDLKSKPNEKHITTKNTQETSHKKAEPQKESSSKPSSNKKTIGEVPKDLIGRIKEAAKPRQIQLLDTCPFLVDPVIENRKTRNKPRKTVKNSASNKCPTSKSVSSGISTSTSIASRHSTSSTGSRSSTSLVRPVIATDSLVPPRQTTSSTASRPTTSSVRPVISTDSLVPPRQTTSSTASRPTTSSVRPVISTDCLVPSRQTTSSAPSRHTTSSTPSRHTTSSTPSRHTTSSTGSRPTTIFVPSTIYPNGLVPSKHTSSIVSMPITSLIESSYSSFQFKPHTGSTVESSDTTCPFLVNPYTGSVISDVVPPRSLFCRPPSASTLTKTFNSSLLEPRTTIDNSGSLRPPSASTLTKTFNSSLLEPRTTIDNSGSLRPPSASTLTKTFNSSLLEPRTTIDNSGSLRPTIKTIPTDTSRPHKLSTSSSDASTSTNSQEKENDKFWHSVNWDHNYYYKEKMKNGEKVTKNAKAQDGTSASESTTDQNRLVSKKLTEPGENFKKCTVSVVNQTKEHNVDENSQDPNRKINLFENNVNKCEVRGRNQSKEQNVDQNCQDSNQQLNLLETDVNKCTVISCNQTKEQNVEDGEKPKKKIINWEDYKNHKRNKLKPSSPGSENGSKTMNQEEWIKKMALDVEPLTQEPPNKPEQPTPAEIPGPPSVPGMIYKETFDVSVNACVADESALIRRETLEEVKPLLQKSNVKINQSSLISCLTDHVSNKIPTNKNTGDEEEVVRFNRTIRHVKADLVKPTVRSVEVQTNISLMDVKSPKRRISISSSSSTCCYDRNSRSDELWDSRYSRRSRKRSRSSSDESRDSRYSRRSRNRSRSPSDESRDSRYSRRSRNRSRSPSNSRSDELWDSRYSRRSRKRSRSSSDESRDSRYSRRSRNRSRSSRSPYRSRGSTSSRSTSPLHPNIQLPKMFKTKQEHIEFKRDAHQRRILFLNGVPDHIDEDCLYKTFEKYGEIKKVQIFNRGNKRIRTEGSCGSESYSFITFTDCSGVFDAMRYYEDDYPNGEKYIMCFGGRREFCREKYSDLDNMPTNYQYETPHYERKPEMSFDSMLEEYKKRRKLS